MDKDLGAKFSDITVYEDTSRGETEHARRVFHTLAGECIGDTLYMFGTDSNSICKVDMGTGNIDIQYGNQEVACCTQYLYKESIVYGTDIYFISDKTDVVLKYNVITGQRKYICNVHENKLYTSCIYKGNLYLLPIEYSEKYICIHLKDESVHYFATKYKERFGPRISMAPYLFGNGVLIGDCIYRGSYIEPCIEIFHISSGQLEYVSLNDFHRPIRRIAYDGVYIWLLSQSDGTIARWDPVNRRVVFKVDLAGLMGTPDIMYGSFAHVEGNIYVIPTSGTYIIMISTNGNSLCCYDCGQIPGFSMREPRGQAFSDHIRADKQGTVYFFPFKANGVVAREKGGAVRFYKTETTKTIGLAAEQKEQNETTCTLEQLCRRVQSSKKDENRSPLSGKKIWENIYQNRVEG